MLTLFFGIILGFIIGMVVMLIWGSLVAWRNAEHQ